MAQDFAEKVALLLAKAEGTDNPDEAEAYTAKAEELMLKHGIEEAQVQAKRPGARVDPIIIERIYVNGTYEAATVTYGYAVAPAFNCKSYQSKGREKGHYIWLVGHTSDVEQAQILLRSILVQSEMAMRHWWENGGRERTGGGRATQKLARRQFMFGFGNGVRERLSEVRNRVVHESEPGTALVLVDRGKKVDSWVNDNMKFSKSKGGSLKGGTYEASNAGHAAGREAVGQKSVH